MHFKSYSHFFSKKFQHICVSLNVNINESLTNDIVSFEQLGPDLKQHLFHQRRLRSACAYAQSVQSLRRSNVPSIASRLSKEGWTRTCRTITKTYLYNFDPLKPHFYIVKLGFPGVYIILLFLLKNIDCGYSLEPPQRGGSNEYPQSMF